MKFTLSFALALSLFTTAFSQWGGIAGEGDIVKKEIQLDKFSGVLLGISGDVYLTQGPSQKVIVEAQENIIANLETQVRGGVWSINFDRSVRKAKPVKVYITIPELTVAGVSGSGDVMTEGAFTGLGDVDVLISGSGNVGLDIEAKRVEGTLSGSGTIHLKGSSEAMKCTLSGSGDIKASDHRTGDCEITISGSGNAHVHATANLEARIAGSGNIRYQGSPSVRAKVSGSGEVMPAQ